jgi:broad specificity phosphatase PhoE
MTQAPEMVVVSSFRRAMETAMPILSRFQGAGQVTLPVHEFTYLSPERCRATSFDDRRAMVRDFWERADPIYVDGVGAESFLEFRERIRNSLCAIATLRCQNVLVVSHAQVIQMARAAVLFGSFESVSMADFRNLMGCRPIANLELLVTHVDDNWISMRCSFQGEFSAGLSTHPRIAGVPMTGE